MAKWKAEKKAAKKAEAPEEAPKPEKPKKGMPKTLIAIAVILALGVSLFYLLSYQAPIAERLEIVSIDISPQPAPIGWAHIVITTNSPVSPLTVYVGQRLAERVSIEGSVQTFRLFVSPYESDGLYQLYISGEVQDSSRGFVISTTSLKTTINSVIFYSDEKEGSFEQGSEGMFMFFEMDSGQTERNSFIIRNMMEFITGYTAIRPQPKQYFIEVSDGEAVSCYDMNQTWIALSDCTSIMEDNPHVLVKIPEYPTSQVRIGSRIIEVQPSMDDGMAAALGAVLKMFQPPEVPDFGGVELVYDEEAEELNATG